MGPFHRPSAGVQGECTQLGAQDPGRRDGPYASRSGALAALALALAATARADAHTVVSLTFDDGTDTQYWALGQLQAHGMTGTFYVNSSKIGEDGYMTWSQLHDLSDKFKCSLLVFVEI